ncbi:MAG: Serine/threonine-protein kinase PknD [Phycisphaerae bacterium]|nr:Serine/threonine-protein kinase PknD [Phycisphaerae bacterium]
MPHRAAHVCPYLSLVEPLAGDRLPPAERRLMQTHLEECDTCREEFHRRTGENFPAIPQYTIVERVGEGGFGIVYKAVHHAKHRTEALKVLFGETDVRAAYFQNEVHLVARLSHANIARLYEAHLDAPPLYYCMEFVDGERLDSYVMRRDVRLAQRVAIVRTIALAVAHAHEQGVVHRDIKPQNILIDRGGQPRIVDFGIGKRLGLRERVDPAAAAGGSDGSGSDSTNDAVGTLGYMAPEQAGGQKVDGRADVYSLGALLYFCITGEPPRKLASPEAVLFTLRRMKVTRAPDLAAIIRRCLAFAPEQRYAGCIELAADLSNYLVGLPTAAAGAQTLRYRAARVADYVIRNHPLAVQGVIAVLSTLLLSAAFARLAARATWATDRQDHSVALLAVTPETIAQLRQGAAAGVPAGVTLDDRKSFRLLHGEVLRRLAAAQPRVVVLDHYFPDCQPDYDPPLIDAIGALRAPVIVGARRFDQNSAPEMCPDLRRVVHTCGDMRVVYPTSFVDVELVVAARRGANPPVPALSVAAFAAYQEPNADLRLEISERELTMYFARRAIREDELRWIRGALPIPLLNRVEARGRPLTEPGETLYHARLPLSEGAGAPPVIAIHEALRAGDDQWRAWFRGKAVMIGDMSGPGDRYRLPSGVERYGCQFQAQVLQAMIDGAFVLALSRAEIVLRAAGWSIVAVLAMRLLRRLPARIPLESIVVTTAILFVGGLILTANTAMTVTDRWQLEALMAAAALLVAGAMSLAAEGMRTRQIHLSPDLTPAARPSGDTTLLAPAGSRAARTARHA